MATKDAAIRKRTQIAKANRTMFVWVAAVSVIVGFGLVGTLFLAQKLIFNEKVLAEKNKTIATLQTDNANIPNLESNVRILNDNQALINAKANPSDQAIQAILDALPSEANSNALGASLQNKLLAGIPGLTLQSIQVDPVVGVEQLGSTTTVTDASAVAAPTSGASEITFRFSVSGPQAALQQVLQNLEHSIRAINIGTLGIASQGSSEVMTVQGSAFYQSPVVVQLTNKTVKP